VEVVFGFCFFGDFWHKCPLHLLMTMY
jgi:hypothetical protein